jgi:hypothetical protein
MGAAQLELKSIEKFRTWDILVSGDPINGQVIKSRWVFTKKRDGRYKARLVARGDMQNTTKDEVYTHTLPLFVFRFFLAIVSTLQLQLIGIDVNNAFLNADQPGNLFMSMPDDILFPTGQIVRLRKACYGTASAPKQWAMHRDSTLTTMGFEEVFPGVWLGNNDTDIIIVYCDDFLCASREPEKLYEILAQHYDIKKQAVTDYLGVQMEVTAEGIYIHQTKYQAGLLTKFGMSDARPVSTPGYTSPPTSASDDVMDKVNKWNLNACTGAGQYLIQATRPDCTFALNNIARDLKSPTTSSFLKFYRLLQHIIATPGLGLFYASKFIMGLAAHADASLGTGDDNRSITGGIIFFNNGVIYYKTKLQGAIALSTAEAEVYAIITIVKEVLFMRRILKSLRLPAAYWETPTPVYTDSMAAIHMILNDSARSRIRHVDVKLSFLRQALKDGEVSIQFRPSKENLADGFTKALPRPEHQFQFKYMVNIV